MKDAVQTEMVSEGEAIARWRTVKDPESWMLTESEVQNWLDEDVFCLECGSIYQRGDSKLVDEDGRIHCPVVGCRGSHFDQHSFTHLSEDDLKKLKSEHDTPTIPDLVWNHPYREMSAVDVERARRKFEE